MKNYIMSSELYKKENKKGLVGFDISTELNRILNELNLFYILSDSLKSYIIALLEEKLSEYNPHGKIWISRFNARDISFDMIYVYFSPTKEEQKIYEHLSAPIIEIKLQSKQYYIRKKEKVPAYVKDIVIPTIKDILNKMQFTESSECICNRCNL